MQSEPQKEHAWLTQLEGSWSFDGECDAAPGQPPMKMSGKETVRSLGGLWILCEGVSTMPGGGEARSLLTIGYDVAKGCYVGSFVASMMTMMWLYEGRLDEAGRVLTLDCEGPDMMGDGSRIPYQDIIEVVDADTRLFRSRAHKDGGWREFMRTRYRRA